MKNYLLILLSFVFVPVFAQKITIENGKLNGIIPLDDQKNLSYQVIKTAEGVSKDEIFKRARKWFIKTYNTPNQVIQLNDPVSGEIFGKGIFYAQGSHLVTATYPIRHLLAVEVKEAKYRITLSSFSIDDPNLRGPIDRVPMAGRKFYDNFFSNIDTEAHKLLNSLEKAIAQSDEF